MLTLGMVYTTMYMTRKAHLVEWKNWGIRGSRGLLVRNEVEKY